MKVVTQRSTDRTAAERVAINAAAAGESDWKCSSCGGRNFHGVCSRPRCDLNAWSTVRRKLHQVKAAITAWQGETMMLTLTGPGGQMSEWDKWTWNVQMMERWAKLNEAAVKSANRSVKGVCVQTLGWVPEVQARGLWHLHVVLGATDARERNWSNTYARYVKSHAVHYGFGQQTKSGRWGDKALGDYVSKLGGYLSKGSEALTKAYQDRDITLRAWYTSKRLKDATGVTAERVRRRGMMYRKLRVWIEDSLLADWCMYEKELRRQLTTPELYSLCGLQV